MKKYFVIKGRFDKNFNLDGWRIKTLDDGRLMLSICVRDDSDMKKISLDIEKINNLKLRNYCSIKFVIENDIYESFNGEYIESANIHVDGKTLNFKRVDGRKKEQPGQTVHFCGLIPDPAYSESLHWSASCLDDDCLDWSKRTFSNEVYVHRIFNFMSKIVS
jgi:hypothetical protein